MPFLVPQTLALLRSLALAAALLVPIGIDPAAAQLRCRAVDGDTLVCGDERVRLRGLDAPELRGRCPEEARLARMARDRMRQLVADGITLHPEGRDRYRRVLARATDRRGRDVANIMIAEGLARPYAGRGRRAGWCQ